MPIRFDVLSLFPELIENYCSSSIIGRARTQGIIDINIVNPRDFSKDKHRKVDDIPYGGGAGMVLACDPIFSAVESVNRAENSQLIMLSPQGRPFNNDLAMELSQKDQLIMLCGHYEGFDERIRTGLNPMEISIGDFVLTGGELAALCILDAVTRFLPGALGKIESAHDDSFFGGLLEYPHYTRPAEYRGMKVPEVLMSGNHALIAKWRREQAIIRTWQRRPDLFEEFAQKANLKEDIAVIQKLNSQQVN